MDDRPNNMRRFFDEEVGMTEFPPMGPQPIDLDAVLALLGRLHEVSALIEAELAKR